MWLNAVPVAFLMENVLVLYGIRNGMADSTVAVLASFVHLTMPFMVFGRNLIARFGLAKAWGLGWGLRYVSILLLLFAPWAGEIGQWAASGVIMLGAFGFALFRSLGAINTRPLVGEITTDDERGRYISGNFARFTSVQLLAMTAAILLMQNFDAVWVYQVIIATGAAVGFIGAYVLTTIPESGESRKAATEPLGIASRALFQDKSRRRTVWAFGAGFSSFVLVIPFATITVKNGYGVPDHEALVFTLLVVAGGIVSSLVNREISDHVGPRPLVILYTTGLLLVALFWAFAPETLQPGLVALSFFVAGYCKLGLIVGLGHYLLSTTPGRQRLVMTLFTEIVGGAAAGLAGAVFGGTLIGVLQDVGVGMEVYRWYFRIVAVVVLVMVFIMSRLRRIEDWRVPEVLGLVFSPRDVWALFTLNRLEDRSSPGADLSDVARLRQTRSSLSQARLREYVYSPRLEVRMSALRALRNLEMDHSSVKLVMEQIDAGAFTTGWLAADILGEQRVTAAVAPLRRALQSDDPFLAGKAMVNLVRIGDSESYDEIRRRFRAAEQVRVIIYGSKAIAAMQQVSDLPVLLEKACRADIPEAVKDEVLISAARLCGAEDRYYRLIRTHKNDPDAALESKAKDTPKFWQAWCGGEHGRALSALREQLPLRSLEQVEGSDEDDPGGREASQEDSAACGQAVASFLAGADGECVDARTALCLLVLTESCSG